MRRVERAAWNAIVRCTRAKKLAMLPLPIPVETWIEGPLKIKFGVVDLSALGPNVLGVSRPKLREILVSQSIADQEARFRFTAAHELGHVLLHSKLRDEFRESADRDYVERRIEREADRFAAAFLMPLPTLCTEITRVCQANGAEPDSVLAGTSAGDPASRRVFGSIVLPHVTRRFGVSLSAAAHRFSDVAFATGQPALPREVCRSFLSAQQVREAIRRD